MGAVGHPPVLNWLPVPGDFGKDLARVRKSTLEGDDLFRALRDLANRNIDFLETRSLDKLLSERKGVISERLPKLRLALLGTVTLDHLAASIRIGALRRGLLIDIWVGPFDQWRQEIVDPTSALYAFKPDAVLLAIDPAGLLPSMPLKLSIKEADGVIDEALDDISRHWEHLRAYSNATIIQQTIWNSDPPIFGHFERLVYGSRDALASRLDSRLVEVAAAHGIQLLDLKAAALSIGTKHIVDMALWHHAKQAVSPAAAPWVGDQVARIAAALRGLSKKLLVLDLDDTLWGGTIGDAGLSGIALGAGSGEGEAFLAFQRYLKRLTARGILLAISSKNDQSVVEAALDQHPEMLLRRRDFAAVEANWHDKPSAVQRIADRINLGLDAVVFFDDNPFERDLMRRSLPDVSVPEVPDAPELYARCLSESGYFEAVSFTGDDSQRNTQYIANAERTRLRSAVTDLDAFLRDLRMKLKISAFCPEDLPRITQLINKTNQFNLTTRRYSEGEVNKLMRDPSFLTFSVRVSDRLGDNGLTGVAIVRLLPARHAAEVDTWLMSCRVLGRRIEHAMFSVMASEVRAAGTDVLIGRFRPTARNAMVKDLYPTLGFRPAEAPDASGEQCWTYPVEDISPEAPDHLEIIYTRKNDGPESDLHRVNGNLTVRL